jgi:aminoglycoside phosphotransferase (APT) family kinase protein
MAADNRKWLDRASPVRQEDVLDAVAVGAFVRAHVPGLTGIPEITQFRGGASNLTYQLAFENKVVILRCAPGGAKAKSAHNMEREFEVMRQLKPFFPAVPDTLIYCHDVAVIGRPFYLMEKIPGIILRANLPDGLDMSPDAVRALCCNAIDQLIHLHGIDIESSGLSGFGKGAGYVQRQVEGWSDRYKKAKTWNVPAFKGVMEWLAQHLPQEEHICFIHNDFRFDNLVLDPDDPPQIIGVLDWEMATVGDRFMDLGNTLAYWVQADDDFIYQYFRRQPTHLPGMMTRREVVGYYCEKTGIDPGSFRFYEVYGLFRLAVIAQQIYYRYYHRQTTNPAFRHFWFLIHYLHYRCKKAIRQGDD